MLAAALVLAALVAAGAVFAVVHDGGKKAASSTSASGSDYVNVFYLQRSRRVRVQNRALYIRFIWKPNHNADQYIVPLALIMAFCDSDCGHVPQDVQGLPGVSSDVGLVALHGGYQVWSAS